MSTVTDIGYVRPVHLAAALDARAAHPDWLVLAGGTDAMVDGAVRSGAAGVLDLFGLQELHGIELHGDRVHIGACTTYSELLGDERIALELPLLHHAAGDVGAVQVRERGTIGGNVVTASPVGDLLPGLLALDACVVVASVEHTRVVPYEHFILGFRRVGLRPDELLVGIEIPRPPPDTEQFWRKVGTRSAQAVTKVSMAATARIVAGRVDRIRLAFGAVADRPLRLHAVEALATGAEPGIALGEAVRSAVADALRPITDGRSTAGYRRDVAAGLAARFVAGLGSG